MWAFTSLANMSSVAVLTLGALVAIVVAEADFRANGLRLLCDLLPGRSLALAFALGIGAIAFAPHF